MTITVFLGVAALFQSIGMLLCPVNQYQAPGVNLCYEMTPSAAAPNKMDSQFLDNMSDEYLATQWISSSTMLSREQTETTTLCWYDDQTNLTFPCQ